MIQYLKGFMSGTMANHVSKHSLLISFLLDSSSYFNMSQLHFTISYISMVAGSEEFQNHPPPPATDIVYNVGRAQHITMLGRCAATILPNLIATNAG